MNIIKEIGQGTEKKEHEWDQTHRKQNLSCSAHTSDVGSTCLEHVHLPLHHDSDWNMFV